MYPSHDQDGLDAQMRYVMLKPKSALSLEQGRDRQRWRYETDDRPIYLQYGYDGYDTSGVFFSVSDSRLTYSESAEKSVNKVTESVGIRDGGGSYFDLHTGSCGFGLKVSDETMKVFLHRYGVDPHHILRLFPSEDGIGVPSSGSNGGSSKKSSCNCCGTTDNVVSICSGCRMVRYCNKECQKQDWNLHKEICRKNKK